MSELDITLRLRIINHLFESPDISPLSDDYQPYSSKAGMDHILGELYAHPAAERINLTVLLPRESITTDLEQRTRHTVRASPKRVRSTCSMTSTESGIRPPAPCPSPSSSWLS